MYFLVYRPLFCNWNDLLENTMKLHKSIMRSLLNIPFHYEAWSFIKSSYCRHFAPPHLSIVVGMISYFLSIMHSSCKAECVAKSLYLLLLNPPSLGPCNLHCYLSFRYPLKSQMIANLVIAIILHSVYSRCIFLFFTNYSWKCEWRSRLGTHDGYIFYLYECQGHDLCLFSFSFKDI